MDELIKRDVIAVTSAVDTAFHGAGREDIDALMLGSGRPFVVEALSPRIRSIDLKQLQEAINSYAVGKVEVLGLQIVPKEMVEKLKSAHADKVYNLKVTFREPSFKGRTNISTGKSFRHRDPAEDASACISQKG